MKIILQNPLLIILIISSLAGFAFLFALMGSVAKFRIIRAIRMLLPTLLFLSVASLAALL